VCNCYTATLRERKNESHPSQHCVANLKLRRYKHKEAQKLRRRLKPTLHVTLKLRLKFKKLRKGACQEMNRRRPSTGLCPFPSHHAANRGPATSVQKVWGSRELHAQGPCTPPSALLQLMRRPQTETKEAEAEAKMKT